MRRLGILGGRFDPPHIAHLIHARLVLENYKLSKILFIPSAKPPHKGVKASFNDRFQMTRLATDPEGFSEVSDVEQTEDLSYTIDTLNRIKEQYPDTDLFLIIGQDEYDAWDTWHKPDSILKTAKLIVLPRGKEKPSAKTRVHFPDLPLIEISSTEIRKRISGGKPVTHWVPERVEEYIINRKLYKENHG